MTDILNLALTGLLVFGGVGGDTTAHFWRLPVEARSIEISSVRLTGYNAVAEQTNDEPHITASGAYSNADVVIARSRDMADVLPYGTVVALEVPREAHGCGFSVVKHFVGYRVVADTMHKRKTKQADILFGVNDTVRLGERNINPATALGICEATLRVVGYVPINEIPKTQMELAWLVEGRQLSLR